MVAWIFIDVPVRDRDAAECRTVPLLESTTCRGRWPRERCLLSNSQAVLTDVNCMVQFVSQVKPLSDENACSHRGFAFGVESQVKRILTGLPSTMSSL